MKSLFTFTVLVITLFATAQTSSKNWVIHPEKPKVFIENKGQWNGRNNLPGSDILYATGYDDMQVLFTARGLTYRLEKKEMYTRDKEKDMKEMGDKDKLTHEEWEELKRKESVKKEIDFVQMEWLGANANVQVVPLQAVTPYFNYDMGSKSINHANGYEKLLYRNIYPNIDLEYIFNPKGGIEYSFILYPGADASQIKMKYSNTGTLRIDAHKNLRYATLLGDIVEHAAKTFYQNAPDKSIATSFTKKGNVVSFALANYDKTKVVVIDPWVQGPAFNTQWDCVWECEKDAAGNVYIIGGVMPMELHKYDPAGNLQWTYNTTYDTTAWLGTFATDNAGNSYVTQGSIAKIRKVNTAGALVWNNANPGGIFASTEFWSISFNCDQTKLVIGGTGSTLPPLPYIYQVDMNSGNVTSSVQVTGGALFPTQEVRSIIACGNGRYYFLTHDSIGYLNQNYSVCSNVAQAKYYTNSTYGLSYKCENFRYDNTGICALKYYGGYVFSCRGNQIDKRDFATGNIVATAAIPGGAYTTQFGASYVENSGIDIDDCGNIYVGSKGQVVKYNQSLTQLTTYTTSFNVYDVHVSTNGDVIACGSTGTSSSGARQGYIQSFAAGACSPIAITCCDASICLAGPFCTTDAPVTLTPSTPGGVWSGPGVNPTTGVFTPSVAGQGTHHIRYTINCGSDSIAITVNLCATLNACLESNSSVTVSNGTGPYTWYQQVQQQNCAGCLLGCTFPPGCATNVNVWQSFATGTNATPPSYPVKVTDSNGNELIINSAASLSNCSVSCALTATATPTPTTCGGANGGASVAASGGTPTGYLWSNGASAASISNVASGTYTVTVSAGACSATASAVVAASSAINATTSKTNATCTTAGSATVSITGGTATGYLWSNSTTSATASNLAAGNYTVTVTAGTCTATASASIILTGSISASATSTNAGCVSNGTATVSVSGGTATGYLWSNGGTTAAIANLSAGSYTVTVTAGSCTATATTTVSSSAGITISSSTTSATCGSSNGSATVSVTSGTATGYSWSSGSTSATASNLAAGTYTVTVSANGGCSATASAIVSAVGAPVLTTSSTPSGCTSSTGSATVSVTSGTATAYSWSSGSTTATAGNLAAGNYTVTVTGTGGCTATASAVVAANGAPVLTTSTTTAGCTGNTGSATVSLVSGTALSYNWSSGATTATASNLAAGTYTVTVNGPGGCTATASAIVNSAGGVSINATYTNTSCGNNNGTATVTVVSGNATGYSWSNGGTTSGITGLAAGTYGVTVSDGAGCTATATVTVGGSGASNITITSDKNTMCNSDSAHVCAPAGYVSYLWNTGATAQCITTLLAGNYYVTVTDNGGCTATSNHLAINVLQPPPVSISVNGDSLLAYNAVSYQWYLNGVAIPGATNPLCIATVPGSYTVVVTAANGCSAQSIPVIKTITGVEEIEKDGISVYPNPNASGNWNLSVTKPWLNGQYEIFDAEGRLISHEMILNQLSEITLTVSRGVYVIRLSSGGKNAAYRLIKL